MLLLYEVGIWILVYLEKRRQREEENESPENQDDAE